MVCLPRLLFPAIWTPLKTKQFTADCLYKPKRTILSNTIFSWSKLIFAWANVLLHGQMYYYMGKCIITWANVLLHGQIYNCMAKSIIPWPNLLFHGQIYYFMGIFIILCAICYFHGQIVIIACANLCLFSCAKFRSGSSRLRIRKR